jgi:uncharacterized protein (DUF58 family)
MIAKDLARKVKLIEITTKKAVTAAFAGEYASAFKGRGMEFHEVREYHPGDEIRTIDWNVTARTGVPHTKRFVEERELTVMFLVDLSGSGRFGSGAQSKNEVASELCSLLAFSAIRNNDRVGLLLFTDQVEYFIPPRKGENHVLHLIYALLSFTPEGRGTDIAHALDYTGQMLQRRAVIFLISDFLDSGYEKQMQVIGGRHDLVAVSLSDPREAEVPGVGLVDLADAETGETRTLDTSNASLREAYRASWQDHTARLRHFCTRSGIDHLPITAGENYVTRLVRYFAQRETRM